MNLLTKLAVGYLRTDKGLPGLPYYGLYRTAGKFFKVPGLFNSISEVKEYRDMLYTIRPQADDYKLEIVTWS